MKRWYRHAEQQKKKLSFPPVPLRIMSAEYIFNNKVSIEAGIKAESSPHKGAAGVGISFHCCSLAFCSGPWFWHLCINNCCLFMLECVEQGILTECWLSVWLFLFCLFCSLCFELWRTLSFLVWKVVAIEINFHSGFSLCLFLLFKGCDLFVKVQLPVCINVTQHVLHCVYVSYKDFCDKATALSYPQKPTVLLLGFKVVFLYRPARCVIWQMTMRVSLQNIAMSYFSSQRYWGCSSNNLRSSGFSPSYRLLRFASTHPQED